MTSATEAIVPPAGVARLVSNLRAMALRGLARMYQPDAGRFVFTNSLDGERVAPQGLSARYTAIALIGLAREDRSVVLRILAGRTAAEACEQLFGPPAGPTGIGDAALVCWAARDVECARHPEALRELMTLEPDVRPCATVELSWALSALCAESSGPTRALRDRVAARLLAAFRGSASGFPHSIDGGGQFRSHVSCFADQIYPILALSQYGVMTGHTQAIATAERTAAHLCQLQGPAGQWWWHYHSVAGSLVESYPVYAVHQHGMAPMALMALERASGGRRTDAIARGLDWLRASPELGGKSLIDPTRDFVWRKVGRREPAKAARYLQACATRLQPGAVWPMLDRLFPPGVVDFECRPYELGWLLYAWPPFVAPGPSS